MTQIHFKELVFEMFTARDKAVIVASTTMNERLRGMNEFRDALRDQASHFITRNDLETLRGFIERNEDKIAAINARTASLETKLYLGGAGILVVLSVVQVLLNLLHVGQY